MGMGVKVGALTTRLTWEWGCAFESIDPANHTSLLHLRVLNISNPKA